MLRYIILILVFISCFLSLHTHYGFPFVKRVEWHARPPKYVSHLETTVPFVVIHHTAAVSRCYNRQACCDSMRLIQDYHMDEKDWWDIRYNFGVGSDGAVYEGRGWDILGAQSLHFNEVSIGIACLGNWTCMSFVDFCRSNWSFGVCFDAGGPASRFALAGQISGGWGVELPPERQLNSLKALLQSGVDLGYVEPDYTLFGHRDLRDTQCPGDALYEEIQTWPHYKLEKYLGLTPRL